MAKPIGIPFITKIGIIALVIASTLAYSVIRKRQIDSITSSENDLILKELPVFSLPALNSDAPITHENLFENKKKAMLIHFWGTWCAPCEAELPEFIEFVRALEKKGVGAILLAVQDDDKKIKKFMKRFGKLPENIRLAHDKNGSSMITFGTVKVPETYLFSKSGKNLNKYIGPQDWAHASALDRVEFYLSSLNQNDKKSYKIETH